MDQLEDLVKDFQTPKVAKVNLKALRDRDEASGGFGAAALWAAASYLLKRYVITPDTTPATTPTTTAHKSHNASNDMATP